MKNWYNRVIVPRLLNKEMASEELQPIRRQLIAEAKGVVLEIGVGPGYNIPLYEGITKLFALDPSEGLIKIARTRAKMEGFSLEFLLADAEHIPLPNESIDTVVSTWTLCSVNNPKKVLAEIKRVLRPEGKFLFVDHGASSHHTMHVLQKMITKISKHFTGNCHYDRNIEVLVKEAGLDLQVMQYGHERFSPLIYDYQGVAIKKS